MPVILGASPNFTSVTLEGTYQNPDGSAATGSMTFTLTAPMENNDVILNPEPITVTLNGSGAFSIQLAANDDAATVPQGVVYGVTELIDGAQPRDYFITLSHTQTTVDISTLMPGQGGWA